MQLSLGAQFDKGAACWREDLAPINIIPYHGGKMGMLDHVLPLIPPHMHYVEPFLGGGAVFWNKRLSKINTINDLNSQTANLYICLQKHMDEFLDTICSWPHAEVLFKKQNEFASLDRQDIPNVRMACDYYFMVANSYLNAGHSLLCNKETEGSTNGNWRWRNVKKRLCANRDWMLQKLDSAQIMCRDALRIIKGMDSEHAFFYCDPPYIGTIHKYYAPFTNDDFVELLATLDAIKGKFLLSTFAHPDIPKRWLRMEFTQAQWLGTRKGRHKTELLYSNF